MRKPTPLSAHKAIHGVAYVPPPKIDMNNSGGMPITNDLPIIPRSGVQRIKNNKTGKVKTFLNTPIQPTPARPFPDKYDDTMSRKPLV